MDSEKKKELQSFHSEFEMICLTKINELIDSSASEIKESFDENHLKSRDQRFNEYKQEVKGYIKQVNKGLERVDDAIDTFDRNKDRILSKEENKKLDQELENYLNTSKNKEPTNTPFDLSDKTIKDFLDIPDHILYCYYKVGYYLFEEGIYKEASNIFLYLSLLNPFVKDYWLGLGISERESENYEASLTALAIASLMDETDPIPHLNSAESYIRIKDSKNAEIELEEAKSTALKRQDVEKWFPIINDVEESINKIKTIV